MVGCQRKGGGGILLFLWDFPRHKDGQKGKKKKMCLRDLAPSVMLNTSTSCAGNLESRSRSLSLSLSLHTKKGVKGGGARSLSITPPLPSLRTSLPPSTPRSPPGGRGFGGIYSSVHAS